MNETARILCAIPSEHEMSIFEVWGAVFGSKPTDLEGIDRMLKMLESFEQQELISVRRSKGFITSVKLTELGAERAREAQEAI